MEPQVIAIGAHNRFSNKANRILAIFLGLTFIGQSIIYGIRTEGLDAYLIMTLLMGISGIGYIFYSYLYYSPQSKWSSKVVVTEDEIKLKPKFGQPYLSIKWNDVEALGLDSFSFSVVLKDQKERFFHYQTNADISVKIKQVLQNFAEQKAIPVTHNHSGNQQSLN
ncbi:MAG: hypothetical protein JXQ90_13405 [Cyclobacteriaceae bacterium]